jgi:hypothetical protein
VNADLKIKTEKSYEKNSRVKKRWTNRWKNVKKSTGKKPPPKSAGELYCGGFSYFDPRVDGWL